MNGSLARWSFPANAGDRLEFAFNYVTTDGGNFTDYAWARLLDAAMNPVAMLFSARTAVSGDSVPGSGLPDLHPSVVLTPQSAAIISLGTDSDGELMGPEWPPPGWLVRHLLRHRLRLYRMDLHEL